jgi:phenylpropionate dioxygenase-like ring-hydroxylating dioxygenase large terminal subunit
MRSRLTPAHYLKEDIFVREQSHIFRKLWLFATFKTTLLEPEAFVTMELGGLPLLIQNCKGQIKAFENICPHRQMPLQMESFGQAKMRCPYHGWVFDDDGKVKTIPHEKTLYAYSDEEKKQFCLKKFFVREVGNLIFINLSANPIPFETQFNKEFQTELEIISNHFGSLSIHSNIQAGYNWKLNYENVLDFNHVPYIHSKTFQPLLNEVIYQNKNQPFNVKQRSTLADLSFWTHSPITVEPWPWHEMVKRYGDGDFYYNFFIYPNVNFISLGGFTFLTQQFHPIAPDRTEVRFTLTTATVKTRAPGLPAILWGHLKSEVSVLQEDLIYLEALQSHMHLDSKVAQHGIYESRLTNAADVYLELMQGSSS